MDDTAAVYIVDDDTALRTSLCELLQLRTRYKISEFSDGERWLQNEPSLAPGCLLLDYSMPGISGLAVLDEMRARNSVHQIVMITGEGNIAVAVQAMHAGANDFIEKPVGFETLIQAIDLAMQRLNDRLGVRKAVIDARLRIDRLKPRELDVLLNLAEGHSNKIIAHRLGLSVRTVEVYRAHLMEKLEVRSLADVIRLAFTAGLLTA
jgi:two-component system, LuxR family, response regulator FixJ